MLHQLFGTFIGLLSLFTLVFLIGMAFYLWQFVQSKIDEDEKKSQQKETNTKSIK